MKTAEKIEDDEFEIDDELELEESEDEELEDDDEESEEDDESEESDDDESEDEDDDDESDDGEVVVSIGEESPPQDDDEKAPEWVRELRKSHRQAQKENRELKAKVEALTGAGKAVELGKKPTLSDFDYDSDKYEAALADWYEQKRKVEEQEAEAKEKAKAQEQAWQNTLDEYGKKKSALKVRDFDDAEEVVQSTLSTTQQGMILQGADDPAVLMYALGKNPKRAKELSSIQDPVKFAFAVSKLETQLKVTNRKAVTKPEKRVTGKKASSGSLGSDSNLERLRAQTAKTGDFSKVTAYRRKMNARQATK